MSVGFLPAHLAVTHGLAASRIDVRSSGTLPGYDRADLCDGTLGRAWRSQSALTKHAIAITLPTAAPASLIALLDVRVYSATARVVSVTCGSGVYGISGPTLGIAGLRRRDCGIGFVKTTSVAWWVEVELSASAPISIGEIVIGDPMVMSTHFREWQRNDARATNRNGDYATRAAARRMSLSCDWAALQEGDHGMMLDVVDAADGALHPVIIVPDLDDPGELYHGTMDDSHPHAQGPDRYHTGHRIVFTESRRPLGFRDAY